MGKSVEKITELDYNELVTISVIENDADLNNIVKDNIKISFNLLRKMAIENSLKLETKELLKDVFDKIILTKPDLIQTYTKLLESDITPKPVAINTKSLPRRYGKQKILKDIEKQDGNITPLQKAMLELNNLKNITVNLNNRCIKTYFNEDKVLIDEDCLDIIAVVKIAKQKLKNVLNKK